MPQKAFFTCQQSEPHTRLGSWGGYANTDTVGNDHWELVVRLNGETAKSESKYFKACKKFTAKHEGGPLIMQLDAAGCVKGESMTLHKS